ncbi:hypothetical protein BKA70DRAFT_556148 [Coprinopsis sp. MPI-PUGE-AT-0042]|nr:hypothetical protein BKA70DRAFT_556148 [Coprinopsis sp. MPI-PUGE-AT-0042]
MRAISCVSICITILTTAYEQSLNVSKTFQRWPGSSRPRDRTDRTRAIGNLVPILWSLRYGTNKGRDNCVVMTCLLEGGPLATIQTFEGHDCHFGGPRHCSFPGIGEYWPELGL